MSPVRPGSVVLLTFLAFASTGCPEGVGPAQCPDGRRSVDGTCRLVCSRDSQCLLSEVCDQPTGACLPKVDANRPEIALFEVGPSLVDQGDAIQIDYVVLFAEEVEIVARSGGSETPVLARTPQPLAGEVMFGPVTQPIEVVIRAYRDQAMADDSLVIQLRDPNSPKIDRFDAEPSTVKVGESTIVSWSVRDADSVSLTNVTAGEVMSGLALQGTQSFEIRRNTELLLRAENETGPPVEARLTVEVEIIEPPTVDELVAISNPVPHDVPAVVYWRTSNATNVELHEGEQPIVRSLSLPEALQGAWLLDQAPGRTEYELVASGPQGAADASTAVEKLPPPPDASIRLTAAQPLLNQGGDILVSWTAMPAEAQVTLTLDDGQPMMVGRSDTFTTAVQDSSVTHEVLLRAEVPGGGVAEARHLVYRVVQESDARADAPQLLDRAAVSGSLDLTDVLVDDHYEVQVPPGGTLDAKLVEHCMVDLGLEVTDPVSGQTWQASGSNGVCPEVSVPSTSGTLEIRVFASSVLQLGEVPYILVPQVKGPPCGDGNVQQGESCDDGNRRPNDGCSPDCTPDPAFTYLALPLGSGPIEPPTGAVQIRNWRPLDGGSGPTADEAYAVLPLPFEVLFYGRRYRGLAVYTNGFVGFLPDWGDPSFEATRPLAEWAPRAVVSLFGTDLVIPPSGGVYVSTEQDTEEITIEYRDVVPKSSPGATMTGRITLTAGGEIRLSFGPMQGSPDAILQVGILSPLGTHPAFAPDCNPSCGVEKISEIGGAIFARPTNPGAGG